MKNGEKETKIPVIDLFAGPGGLGEGFSCFPRGKQKKRFKIHLSVEKDANAHKTLTLRAFYRQFPEGKAPDEYYEYVRGKGYFKEEITWEDLKKRFPKQTAAAEDEARRLKLGEPESDGKVHDLIKVKTESVPYWVLVGGPPCQAYSLAGRSRRLGFVKKDRETEEEFQERKQKGIKEFEEDEKQKLYEEYRRIIADHWPSVFVMENVKGMGSARDKIDGNRLFPKMIEELSDPGFATKGKTGKHTYNVYSFLTGIGDRNGNDLSAGEYEIHSESFAVPQKRHRIILLGIRDDLNIGSCKSLKTKRRAVLEDVIRDLPPLDSSITRAPESTARTVISDFESSEWFKELLRSEGQEDVIDEIRRMARLVRGKKAKGGRFLRWEKKPEELRWEEWFHDPKLEGVLNHESRRHMASDLERYFFASCFTRARGKSPTLVDFPEALLPNHKNIV
ncbi:MAG: DNA cytosine methyltransferase, partial [Verrucomicrobiota bacterium]